VGLEELPGCLIAITEGINEVLVPVAEVLAGDEFVGGEFERVSAPIDVAEVVQVGGIAYSVELEFETSIKNGMTVTNNDTIKVDASGKVPLKVNVEKVPMQFGEIEGALRASASFENARVSENSLGSKAKIALRLPADIPVERSYRIRPSFGFSPGGGLRVAYQVDTGGAAASFWERHYGAPDPALHLPHRIVRARDGFKLGTDPSRTRLKGFLVRDGSDVDPLHPGTVVGPLLTEVPRAGDVLQLEVRVTNLSVATAVDELGVLFSAQAIADGEPLGEPVPIGMDTLDYLPPRGQFADAPEAHVARAYVVWDTTGWGPPPGQALVTYQVQVTLDPDDTVRGETHELLDRNADPLRGPTGEVLDPRLEKGQNNFGWALLRIAASPAEEAFLARRELPSAGSARERAGRVRMSLAGPADEAHPVPIRSMVGEPMHLSFRLSSERTVRDYGRLQVFDGDPEAGGTMILARTVQGIGRDTQEELEWRPRTPGRRVLHAIYVGAQVGDHPTLQIPVVIADRTDRPGSSPR
jgi:hypothetical protein